MRTLRFITGNPGKVAELEALLGPGFQVLQDRRGYPEIQADSLEEVARWGAAHLLASGLDPPFLLEDSGLFVDALGGFPGVYSRYALDTIGCDGLVRLLEGRPRDARFEATIAYVDADGATHTFAGTCPGTIAEEPRGEGGFGFDPVFVPPGSDRTFAQMDKAEKAVLSHRGQAVRRFVAWLRESANP